MKETTVEQHLVKKIKAVGGVAWKFVSPGNNGIPDRIAILPGGRVWFIELKRPKTAAHPEGKLRPLQIFAARTLTDLGCNYAHLSSKEEVDVWFRKNTSN